jgi:hypothetical protein
VVTKLHDVREVSLRTDVFSSAEKSIVPRYREDQAKGQIEAGRASLIMSSSVLIWWSAATIPSAPPTTR